MLARYSFVGGGWSYYDMLAGIANARRRRLQLLHRHRA